MLKILDHLLDWIQLQGMKANTVAQVDGICLASNRPHHNSIFRQIIERALSLIHEHDPRRYARITRELRWIYDCYLSGVTDGMFCRGSRACVINFRWVPGVDHDLHAAFYAGILVHESTHAAVESRGILYRGGNRLRIERLCFAEQNRFLARLSAADPAKYPAQLLHIQCDDGFWKRFYGGGLRSGFSFLSRKTKRGQISTFDI